MPSSWEHCESLANAPLRLEEFHRRYPRLPDHDQPRRSSVLRKGARQTKEGPAKPVSNHSTLEPRPKLIVKLKPLQKDVTKVHANDFNGE